MSRPTVKRREACPVDGCFTLAQAEEMLGLRGGGLARWLRRQGVRTRRVGKYRLISIEQLEEYERMTGREGIERVSRRPPGWVGIYRATELAGVSTAFIHKWAARREIEAVRVGQINYYNPESVLACAAKLRNVAPGGWVPVADLGRPDTKALTKWMKRRGYEVRTYMRPESGQRILHVREDAAREWQAHRASYRRGRKLTDAQAAEIRARRAAGEKRAALAQEYGVTEAAIRLIVLGRTYREPS